MFIFMAIHNRKRNRILLEFVPCWASQESERPVTPVAPLRLSFSGLGDTPVGEAGCDSESLVNAISKQALRKRVERLMKPRADGTYAVPTELLSEWKKGNQNNLLDEFKKAGLDKEPNISIFFFLWYCMLTTFQAYFMGHMSNPDNS